MLKFAVGFCMPSCTEEVVFEIWTLKSSYSAFGIVCCWKFITCVVLQNAAYESLRKLLESGDLKLCELDILYILITM